jgi:hypothetical protein
MKRLWQCEVLNNAALPLPGIRLRDESRHMRVCTIYILSFWLCLTALNQYALAAVNTDIASETEPTVSTADAATSAASLDKMIGEEAANSAATPSDKNTDKKSASTTQSSSTPEITKPDDSVAETTDPNKITIVHYPPKKKGNNSSSPKTTTTIAPKNDEIKDGTSPAVPPASRPATSPAVSNASSAALATPAVQMSLSANPAVDPKPTTAVPAKASLDTKGKQNSKEKKGKKGKKGKQAATPNGAASDKQKPVDNKKKKGKGHKKTKSKNSKSGHKGKKADHKKAPAPLPNSAKKPIIVPQPTLKPSTTKSTETPKTPPTKPVLTLPKAAPKPIEKPFVYDPYDQTGLPTAWVDPPPKHLDLNAHLPLVMFMPAHGLPRPGEKDEFDDDVKD